MCHSKKTEQLVQIRLEMKLDIYVSCNSEITTITLDNIIILVKQRMFIFRNNVRKRANSVQQ